MEVRRIAEHILLLNQFRTILFFFIFDFCLNIFLLNWGLNLIQEGDIENFTKVLQSLILEFFRSLLRLELNNELNKELTFNTFQAPSNCDNQQGI